MSKQDRTYTRTPADLERKYAFGQTFAEVYDLVADAQKAASEASAAVDALDKTLSSEQIFNRLTNYGKLQGVFRNESDHIYINADYINSGTLKGANLKVDAATITGTISADVMKASMVEVDAAKITGTMAAGKVDTFLANVSGELIAGKIEAGAIDATILEVDAAKISGTLDAEHLTVDAACIGGRLNAEIISLTGEFEVYDPFEDDDRIGVFGYMQGSSAGLGFCEDYGGHSIMATAAGAKLHSGTSEVIAAGNVTLKSDNAINANKSITVTSDRRAKENINYDVADYLPVFDALMPSTFVWKDGNDKRKHFGMIAQDVEANVRSHDIPLENFAPLTIHEDGTYGLIYEEFVPLLIAKVQQLDAEIKEMKNNG